MNDRGARILTLAPDGCAPPRRPASPFLTQHNGSPAAGAGLCIGDRILEVNGDSVLNTPHARVVELLSAGGGGGVALTVARNALAAQSLSRRFHSFSAGASCLGPTRRVQLRRGSDGFGFSLVSRGGYHCVGLVQPGGAAEAAGLSSGEVIVAVGDATLVGAAHEDLVQMMSAPQMRGLELRVAGFVPQHQVLALQLQPAQDDVEMDEVDGVLVVTTRSTGQRPATRRCHPHRRRCAGGSPRFGQGPLCPTHRGPGAVCAEDGAVAGGIQ